MPHHTDVYIKHRHRSHPVQKQASHRAGGRGCPELRWHCVPTGPDSHTRTRPRPGWARALLTAVVQEALDYLGIFKHCHIKRIQLSSEKVKDGTQTKPVFISAPLPHPQRIVSKTGVGCPLSGHFTSCCRVASGSSGGTVSRVAECLSLAGVAGAGCWGAE